MFRAIIFLFCYTLAINSLSAQDTHSIQINGGIISPMSSSKGLTGIVQFNYSVSSRFKLYFYTGYSAWDKYNITYHIEYSVNQEKHYFKVFAEDDHNSIPVYLGGVFDLHTNKLFTSFLSFELGYSYLSYNSYKYDKIINTETGEVIAYQINPFSMTEVKDHLFGLGLGAGLSHPMTENVNLILTFKLNSLINSDYYGLFSTRGTYVTYLAGFNFKI